MSLREFRQLSDKRSNFPAGGIDGSSYFLSLTSSLNERIPVKRMYFLMMLAGAANAGGTDASIAEKCVNVAQQYATEHDGQSWSKDAEFITTHYDHCIVRVTQFCDRAPYEPYNMRYIINTANWTVSYFEVDGCVDWP